MGKTTMFVNFLGVSELYAKYKQDATVLNKAINVIVTCQYKINSK